MTNRRQIPGHRCPVKAALSVLGGKWKPLIVFYLRSGTKRFSALRRLIPEASQQVLSQQLRELEQDGLMTRTVYPEVPPRVEYALTALGRKLEPVLDLLGCWGEEFLASEAANRADSVDTDGDRPGRTA